MSNQYLKLRRSSVPGKTPDTASLDFGEIALNTYDGLAFMKKSGSAGIEIVTIGATTGSISASYALTASYALNGGGSSIDTGSFAVTSSNIFTGVQTISGSNGILQYGGDAFAVNPIFPTLAEIHATNDTPWLEKFYNDSYQTTDAVMAYFAWNDGRFVFHNESNQSIGLQVNGFNAENGLLVYPNKVAFVNNIEVTGSIIGPSITGSLFGTASWAQNSLTASYALSSSYSTNINGATNHIAYFNTPNSLATSSIYQSGGYSVIINQDNNTIDNPEALYVYQPHPTSINIISGKANLNNYAQINIFNTNQGINASSDIVATANNGDESSNYIDLGINSENFSGVLGGPNSAYLYSTGQHLHIGNASNYPVQFFAGGLNSDANRKLELNPNGLHNITGSLEIDTNLKVNQSVTASNILVNNTITAQTLIVQTITSSVEYVTGSTKFGSLLTDTHQFTGSVSITASLIVAGPINASSFTGSLFGTASWAQNSLTASYFITSSVTSASLAATASYFITSSVTSASLAATASYFITSSVTSASLAATASYFITSSVTSASLAATASYFITSSVTSASLAATASYINQLSQSVGITGSLSILGSTGTTVFSSKADTIVISGSAIITGSVKITGSLNVLGSITGSLFGTASWAQSASYFITSSVTSASLAATASYFITSSVTSASLAATASYFITSSVTSASLAATASYFITSSVTSASYAATASYFITSSVTSASLAATASNILGGAINYIPFFSGSTNLSSSIIYQSASNLGVYTIVPSGALDISFGGSTNKPTILLGADSGLITRTQNTQKFATIAVAPYNNASSSTAIIQANTANNSSSIYIGGGTNNLNSVTDIVFYTAANVGTTSGTERLRINGAALSSAYTGSQFSGSFNKTGSVIINANLLISGSVVISGSLYPVASGSGVGRTGFTSSAGNHTLGGPKNAWYRAYLGMRSLVFVNSETEEQYILGVDDSGSLTYNEVAIATISGSLISSSYSTYALTSSLPLEGLVTASVNLSTITFTKGDGTTFNLVIAQSGSAASASYVSSSNVYGPSGYNSILSSSYANTASWALNFITSSITSASYALTASYFVTSSVTSASLAATASYFITSSVTSASYASTASWALNFITSSVTSASYAATASYFITSSVTSASYAGTASAASNFVVGNSLTASNALITGTITAQTLIVQTITSSVEYSSGSNIFGSQLSNTQQFTGSVSVTGSLSVNGSSVVLSNQTGSMSVATASFATTSISASYSSTASLALNFITSSVTSASYASTASYFITSSVTSASFASTASYFLTSSVTNATSASYAATASSADVFLVRQNMTSSNIQINGTGSISGNNYLVWSGTGIQNAIRLRDGAGGTDQAGIGYYNGSGNSSMYLYAGSGQYMAFGLAGNNVTATPNTSMSLFVLNGNSAYFNINGNFTVRPVSFANYENQFLSEAGSGNTSFGSFVIRSNQFASGAPGYQRVLISAKSAGDGVSGSYLGLEIDNQNANSYRYSLKPTRTGLFYDIQNNGSGTFLANVMGITIGANLILSSSSDNGFRMQIGNPGISGSLFVSGSSVMSGSLSVTQGITGSLFGTASWAQNATSSSYALSASFLINGATASFATSASFASTASWALNFITSSVTSASFSTTSSYALTASYVANASSFPFTGSAIITGSLVVTGSTSIQSLNIGSSQFNNTASITIAGTTTISSLNTGSYISAFYNYAIISSSNARAGQIMSIWSGSTIKYTEAVTSDIGSTSTASFAVALSGGNVNLNVTAPAGWTVRTITNLL